MHRNRLQTSSFLSIHVLDTASGIPADGMQIDLHRIKGEIPLRFGVNDATSHYHVPFLVSLFSFATCRES